MANVRVDVGTFRIMKSPTVWRGGVPHKQKPADIALVVTAPCATRNWSQKDIKTLAATHSSISRIILGLCSQISLVSHLMC